MTASDNEKGLGRGLWAGLIALVTVFGAVLVLLGAHVHDRLRHAPPAPGLKALEVDPIQERQKQRAPAEW